MLDRQPAGLLRWLLRLPISLYRWGLGGLLGDRFLLLHHRGRKSGQPRRTALEVIEADRRAGRHLVAAAWGERADWLLNLRAEPQVEIEVGGRRWPARASELTLARPGPRLIAISASIRWPRRRLARSWATTCARLVTGSAWPSGYRWWL
jgi:deazaflavin-dependent oxidoreductase (nitroreductase family)